MYVMWKDTWRWWQKYLHKYTCMIKINIPCYNVLLKTKPIICERRCRVEYCVKRRNLFIWSECHVSISRFRKQLVPFYLISHYLHQWSIIIYHTRPQAFHCNIWAKMDSLPCHLAIIIFSEYEWYIQVLCDVGIRIWMSDAMMVMHAVTFTFHKQQQFHLLHQHHEWSHKMPCFTEIWNSNIWRKYKNR